MLQEGARQPCKPDLDTKALKNLLSLTLPQRIPWLLLGSAPMYGAQELQRTFVSGEGLFYKGVHDTASTASEQHLGTGQPALPVPNTRRVR